MRLVFIVLKLSVNRQGGDNNMKFTNVIIDQFYFRV